VPRVVNPSTAVIDRVDAVLTQFLDTRTASLAKVGPELTPLAEQARRFVLNGGKRLRPTFAYWGWRAVRPAEDDDTALITAAASLELLHACALVHDDVMDASATRRGQPATHATFARLHRDSGWHGSAERFGASAAILLGDLLLSWADALFASSGLSAAGDARRVFDDMRELVMAGQYLDVLVQARGEFSAEDAVRVVQFKTSKYTVEGPLHLGAAAAGAGDAVFAALTGYGLALGEAFQLRDDVLGIFGDPAITGKPAGDDLREGKRTLLVALAVSGATAPEADMLRSRFGQPEMTDATVAQLRNVIESSGALVQVEQRIAERAAAARRALESPALSPASREALSALAVAATERTT
jgi:geranylgeranyl diphosphate synthase, type I